MTDIKKRRTVALNTNEQIALAWLLEATDNGQSIAGCEASNITVLSAIAQRIGLEKCCARLRSMNWSVRCSHRAAVRRAGFAFCGTHDPGPTLNAAQLAALAMPDAVVENSRPFTTTVVINE